MTDAAGGAGSDLWARASRPLRIAVRAARRTSARAVGEVVDGAFAGLALRGPARVRRLGPGTGRRDYLVELDARDSIGSPGYASAAWELVHRLQDTGAFTLVEADVPVPAYAPADNGVGAFRGSDCAADPLSGPRDWPSPESVETSNWWILFLAGSSCLVPAAVGGVPPAAGVNAGRRPPAGLGVDPGEDGATLGSRKRGARSRRLFRWVLGGGVAALVGDRGEHAQRRVAPVVVVVLDPAGDRGAGVGFGSELLHAAQL